jgi:hypothetical protein
LYYSDDIEKRIGKPDVVHIPERYVPEPEKHLNHYEQIEKEKRMNEIKKVVAAQGVQDFHINESNSYANKRLHNYDYHTKFEEEKRAREQVFITRVL